MKTTNYRLTEERRKFVEENHNLIYSFAKKDGIDVEEYYDLLAIGLCKAGCIYDPARATEFSTLAYVCMKNEYKLYWRVQTNKTHVPEGMLSSYDDYLMYGDEEVEKSDYIDFISGIYGEMDDSEAYVKEFADSLNERERMILYAYMKGYSEKTIAEFLCVTKQRINCVKHKLQILWQRYSKTRY